LLFLRSALTQVKIHEFFGLVSGEGSEWGGLADIEIRERAVGHPLVDRDIYAPQCRWDSVD